MLAKNAESALAGLGCRLIRQPRQPIDSETEFAKASQGPADEFIVRVIVKKGKRQIQWLMPSYEIETKATLFILRSFPDSDVVMLV